MTKENLLDKLRSIREELNLLGEETMSSEEFNSVTHCVTEAMEQIYMAEQYLKK